MGHERKPSHKAAGFLLEKALTSSLVEIGRLSEHEETVSPVLSCESGQFPTSFRFLFFLEEKEQTKNRLSAVLKLVT